MTHKRKSPSSKLPSPKTDPDQLFSHGLAAMGDERWDEAAVTFLSMLKLAISPAAQYDAYQNLSMCYIELERYEEAHRVCDLAEQVYPGQPQPVFSHALIDALQGRTTEAVAGFERYARLYPQLARLVNVKEKVRQLRSIERGELPPTTFLETLLSEHIENNLEVGDFSVAERKAHRMLSANPKRPEAWFTLGVTCLETGRPAEALDAFQQSHRLNPEHVITLYNLGHALLQFERPQEAIPYLEQATRRDRHYLQAWHELGRAYNQAGRCADAIQAWKQALKISPADELTRQRLHEVGEGPEPVKPPLSPQQVEMRQAVALARQRMFQPQVYRYRDISLTVEPEVGYILEDSSNSHNLSVYAGGPFVVGRLKNAELLDLMGNIKLLLRMVAGANTRDVAILAYYPDEITPFNYLAHFKKDRRVDFDTVGHFDVTHLPYFFKLRVDSDLNTVYAQPMQGLVISLRRDSQSFIIVHTLGIQAADRPRRIWGS